VTRPWELPTGRDAGHDSVLRPLDAAVDVLATELAPFVPALAARIGTATSDPPFARLELPDVA
jgi:hypothetical protein